MEFKDWIIDVANPEWEIYIKRLSANDTGASESHQAGIYMPKAILASLFPSLDTKDAPNPEVLFTAKVESDDVPEQELRAIYYNQKTRNEKRITRWKSGVGYTPLQDKEKTGAIAIFAFSKNEAADSEYMRAWVCRDTEEEDYLEEKFGEIDPQQTYFASGDVIFEGIATLSAIKTEEYPDVWKNDFPSGTEIINYLFERKLHAEMPVDVRLLERRKHEFNLFRLVENHHVMPLIERGFDDVEDFIKVANSISNRRKSRSGRSLELHLENVFLEEGLNDFGVQCRTEGNKKPDFLFPNCDAYSDLGFPAERLRMLAVKTTVKDRWRQILNEANRINTSFLFTLQQGVSENQFQEMKDENVQLVVPEPLHHAFPKSVRPGLFSLRHFIDDTKGLYV